MYLFFYSPTRSIFKELEKAKLSTVAESGEKDEFISFGVSQTSSVSMLSTNLKFSKLQLQKSLFEEYRLTAAEILYELEEILQKYAVYNITFPVGIVNLVDYSWHDLTADAYKYAKDQLMYWSFSFSTSPSNEYSGLFPLGLTGLMSLQFKGLSRVFSSTTVPKCQSFGAQPSLWSNSHIHT